MTSNTVRDPRHCDVGNIC